MTKRKPAASMGLAAWMACLAGILVLCAGVASPAMAAEELINQNPAQVQIWGSSGSVYNGIYTNPDPMMGSMYSADDYYMHYDESYWEILDIATDSVHFFSAPMPFSGEVPEYIEFFAGPAAPEGTVPPVMTVTAIPSYVYVCFGADGGDPCSFFEPTYREIEGGGIMLLSKKLDKGARPAWYDTASDWLMYYKEAEILIKSNGAPVVRTPDSEDGWRIVSWPSGDVEYYAPGDDEMPPADGWLQASGEEASITVKAREEAYLPHTTTGNSDWNDYLEVDNVTGAAALYSIEFLPEDAAASIIREIPAGESALLDIKTIAPNATCAKITTSAGVKLRGGHRNVITGAVAEFFLNDTASDTMGYFFTTFNESVAWKGLTIMNPGSMDANVTLHAYSEDTWLGAAPLTATAGDRVVGLTTQWFPGVDIEDITRIVAESDQDILGIVITGNQGTSQITFTQSEELHLFAPPVF